MRQGIKHALNAVWFRQGKFAHALERSLVNIFLHGRILDIFLFESGINCFRPGSENIDAFEISHEQTAQSLALRLNIGCRKRIAVAGIIHRQVGEIRKHPTQTEASFCRHSRGLTSAPSTCPAASAVMRVGVLPDCNRIVSLSGSIFHERKTIRVTVSEADL